MKDIYIYESIDSWLKEEPEATLKGYVQRHTDLLLEIRDDKGFTQFINLSKLFAVVY
ncbi:MAG: hypothetical protein M0Z31_10215 [Clostridia bacterium]|nr:hypothetical protein [Clostridia bacterium]